MQPKSKIRSLIIAVISYLYAFLFTYAAISKIIEFDKFRIQVGQSPLLSAFADIVTIAVPALELIIVFMLFIPKMRITALFSAYVLMVLFTSYIFLILNYSSYVPCSCGGVLSNMGWTEHLVFNIVFVLLAVVAIMLSTCDSRNWLIRMAPLKFTAVLIGSAIISFFVILGLYLLSENLVHQRNNFVRRFDSHAKPEDKALNLKVNSYYFAGVANGKLYLGNSTAPLVMTIIDTSFKTTEVRQIRLDRSDFKFNALQVRVLYPYFFITDGTVPMVYRGKINDWSAVHLPGEFRRFTLAEPIDSTTMAVRITSPSAAANILGIYTLKNDPELVVHQNLLKKQKDGIFDTDGTLLIDQESRLQYIYYYRNEYLTINRKLELEKSGRTIDTITQAKIKVANASNESQMAAPPVIVNKSAATYKNLLFINSERIGKFEDKAMLKHASMIDIYNTDNGQYISSIYVYNVKGEKVANFLVHGTTLYTISGRSLTAMQLDKTITDHFRD